MALSDQASQTGAKINSLIKTVMSIPEFKKDGRTIDLYCHQEFLDEIALLNGKLLHNDQKIEELLKLNEKLRSTNQNLISKNKQITNK